MKLGDILRNGSAESLTKAWNSTEAAGEFTALPAGEYVAQIVAGVLETSRTNATPGYKLTFRVMEGEHAGRQFFHDLWLTPAALAMTKRDLLKLGVTELAQLDSPLPQGIRCKVKLARRKGDDGVERNRVRQFEVVGIDPPDAFHPDAAPAAETTGEGGRDDF